MSYYDPERNSLEVGRRFECLRTGETGTITEVDTSKSHFMVHWDTEEVESIGYDDWYELYKIRHVPFLPSPMERFLAAYEERKNNFNFDDPHPTRSDTVFKARCDVHAFEGGLKVYLDGRQRGLWFSVENSRSEDMVLITWDKLRDLESVISVRRGDNG